MSDTPVKPLQQSPPPVIERVASLVFASLPSAEFNAKADEWQAQVARDYPESEPQQEWKVTVPDKHGVPDFAGIQPELILHRRLWKATPGGHQFAMQCRNGWISFNAVNSPASRRNYAELRAEVERFLPAWCERFGVTRFRETSLLYVNRLSEATTPQFLVVDGNGRTNLQLEWALTAFGNLPAFEGRYVLPFEFRTNIELERPAKAVLTYEVIAPKRSPGQPPDLHADVRFLARMGAEGAGCNAVEALAHLDACHVLLLEAFPKFFTKDALASFGTV